MKQNLVKIAAAVVVVVSAEVAIAAAAVATAALLATNNRWPVPATLYRKPPVRVFVRRFFVMTDKTATWHVQKQLRRSMEKQTYVIGQRADKLCNKCNEEHGHIVTSVTKRGQISRVTCSKCGTVSSFKLSSRTSPQRSAQVASPYDRTRTYRASQTMMHTTF